MYCFAGSLVYLLLRDLIDLMSGNIFTSIITMTLHLSFCMVAPNFMEFKKNDCNLNTEDEDPLIKVKLLQMKLGGGLCVFAGICAIIMPLYSINQIGVGVLYLYLVFVRYKVSSIEDVDDNYSKINTDTEMFSNKL